MRREIAHWLLRGNERIDVYGVQWVQFRVKRGVPMSENLISQAKQITIF